MTRVSLARLLPLPSLLACLSLPALAQEHPLGFSVDFRANPDFRAVPRGWLAEPAAARVEQLGEIAIIEGDDEIIASDGAGGLAITESERPLIANRFYTRFADVYDQIAIFVTFEDQGAADAL